MIYTLPLSLFKQLKAPESCRDPSGLLLGKQDPRLRIVTGGSSRETSNTQKNANYRCRGEVSSLPHETKSSLLEKRAVKPSAGFPFRKVTFQPPPLQTASPRPHLAAPRALGDAARLAAAAAPPQNLGPEPRPGSAPPVPPFPRDNKGRPARRHCRLRPGGVSIGMAARGRRCLPGSGAVWALTRACGNNTRLPAHCLVRGK